MCLVNLAFFNLEKFEDTQKNPTPCPTHLLPHRKWQDMTTTQSPIQKENISIVSYLPHIVFLGCAFLSSPPSIPGWPPQTITSISLAKYWLCHWLLEIIFWLQTVTVRHRCFRKTSTDIWSISPVVTCETSSLGCVSVVQFSSVPQYVWLFVIPWSTAHQASLSITTSRSLLKLMSMESVMPSNHLILCPPLLLFSIFPSIRGLYNESVLHMRWPKYWSFSFNISPSNEHSRLISFRMDWLHLLAVQETLKGLLQHHSQKHQFFSAQLSLWSNSHIHTWPLEKPQLCLDGPL